MALDWNILVRGSLSGTTMRRGSLVGLLASLRGWSGLGPRGNTITMIGAGKDGTGRSRPAHFAKLLAKPWNWKIFYSVVLYVIREWPRSVNCYWLGSSRSITSPSPRWLMVIYRPPPQVGMLWFTNTNTNHSQIVY